MAPFGWSFRHSHLVVRVLAPLNKHTPSTSTQTRTSSKMAGATQTIPRTGRGVHADGQYIRALCDNTPSPSQSSSCVVQPPSRSSGEKFPSSTAEANLDHDSWPRLCLSLPHGAELGLHHSFRKIQLLCTYDTATFDTGVLDTPTLCPHDQRRFTSERSLLASGSVDVELAASPLSLCLRSLLT